jgi:hypothetical protein
LGYRANLEYKNDSQFCDGHAHKISAFLHVYIEKYQIFSKSLFAVKTARQSFGSEPFDPGKS